MEFEKFEHALTFAVQQGEYTGIVHFAPHGGATPTWGFTIWLNGSCILGRSSLTWNGLQAEAACRMAIEEAMEPEEPS